MQIYDCLFWHQRSPFLHYLLAAIEQHFNTPAQCVWTSTEFPANCFNASQHTQVIKFLSTLAQMCIGMLVALCGLHIPVLKKVRERLN